MRQSLIAQLQKEIQASDGPLALRYQKGHSNTTRSKSYKKGCQIVNCPPLDQVLQIDPERRRVKVEPRVTMEQLVKATLPYGLIPPVVPEFKGITVGGAIMGAAAESGSHAWGIFHDTCREVECFDGQGKLITASPSENSDLFYGISGSYGSFGMLVGAELELMPAKPSVLLQYFPFSDGHLALKKMAELTGNVDFLDGIIFAPHHAVVIAGTLDERKTFSQTKEWYAGYVQKIKNPHEELMPLFDYLFRYDQGAFWMGSLLFSPPFLSRYISQGLLKKSAKLPYFSEREIATFKNLPFPGPLSQALTAPLMRSQRLWALLHRAEKWIQDRLVIQDCSIPIHQAHAFLNQILVDPGLFPIWLCPLKGTTTPQHFAPHFGHSQILNFGLYGVPSYSAPMAEIIAQLEEKTHASQGRKVLYSRSYYTEESFWKIYPKPIYETLRQQTYAENRWRGLNEKVLSE